MPLVKPLTKEEIANKVSKLNEFADSLQCVIVDKFLTSGYEFFEVDINIRPDNKINVDYFLVVKLNDGIVYNEYVNLYHFDNQRMDVISNKVLNSIFGIKGNKYKSIIKKSLFLSDKEFNKLPEQTKQLLFKFANIVDEKNKELEIWKD